MYSEEDLASAVKEGVLTQEAANAFRLHVARTRQLPAVDEEYVRLLSGFNDIFVVIACALLLVSVGWISARWAPWSGGLALSLVAWALAEFFTRRRRMALPSIVLLLAFVGGAFAAGLSFKGNFVLASALAGAAAWLHWMRFKVPITVAAGVASVVCFVVALILSRDEMKGLAAPIMFIAGLAVFALAMRWDASDVRRQTRRSDVAFWLHLLAAPLLVHPVFSALRIFDGDTRLLQALCVVGLYVLISLTSLAIDRRALMVSALAYVLYSFSALLDQFGLVSLSFAITALAIGAALLLLSAFWHASRTLVLRLCPSAIRQHLPPIQ